MTRQPKPAPVQPRMTCPRCGRDVAAAKPAPVKPKPVGDDPHAGHLQAVVSFRLEPRSTFQNRHPGQFQSGFAEMIYRFAGQLGEVHDLDVAVRVIGAGGETSEYGGLYPPGSLGTDWQPGHRHSIKGIDNDRGVHVGWECVWCGQQFGTWPGDGVACPGPPGSLGTAEDVPRPATLLDHTDVDTGGRL